jgi:uncharacterized membrane protein YfhO
MTDHTPVQGREQTSGLGRLAAQMGVSLAFFVGVMALVFRYLVQYGRSNVWQYDALSQHFPALYYFNVWARGILAHPSLGVPLWSWRLGLGADIIPTLAFYVVGDPFALISLVFPMHSMELAYEVLLFARVLAACLFAWLYFRKMGARAFGATAGALIYVFSTFTLIAALRHPFFETAVAFFPLVLLGLEYALKDRRSWVLVLGVFLATIANFYFFYMIAIISTIYAAARYVELTPREKRWSSLLPTIGWVALRYALAILLAAPLLLPSIRGILDSWRGQQHYVLALLYSVHHYGTEFLSLTAARNSQLGFAFIAVLLLPIAWFRRKQHPAMLFMLGVLPVFIAVPFFGSVLNGFTFPDNRFAFMWGLFLGLNAALLLSDDRPFSRREIWAMLLGAVGYALLLFVVRHPMQLRVLVPIVLGAVTWLLFALESRAGANRWEWGPRHGLGGEWRVSAWRWGVLAVLVLNIAGSAAFIYDVRGSDFLSQFLRSGTVLSRFEKNPGALAKGLSEAEPAYRVQNDHRVAYGDALVQGYQGTNFYFSIMSRYLTEYHIENDVVGDEGLSFRMRGFDDRAALTTLASVKYVIATKKEAMFVPYGFTPISQDGTATVYQNQFALPLGFVYDAVVPKATYDALPSLQKQEALLQGAVIDGTTSLTVPSIIPSTSSSEVTYTLASSKGATYEAARNRIVKTATPSEVSFNVTPVPGAEMYVALRGIRNTFVNGAKRADVMMGYSAGGSTKREKWNTPFSTYYFGATDQIVNLGSRTQSVRHVKLKLNRIGTLSFKSLQIETVPMAGYAAAVSKLQSRAMRDITFGVNRVSGTVSSPTNGILYLSIPYSTGWTARVDGQAVPTLRVNTAFTGVAIAPGTHTVVLNYFTPWLAAGLAAAALAAATLVGLWAASARRRRRGPIAD